MALSTLGCNLQEIFSAVNETKTKKSELVPNIFGTRIYQSSRGWGRVWKWFFNLLKNHFGKDLQQEKLIKAMKTTASIFKKRLPRIQEDAKTYRNYLENNSTEESPDESKLHKARRGIITWNRATAPFLDFTNSGGNEKLTQIFKTYSSMTYLQDQPSLQKLQRVIDLEGYLHQPLPLKELGKLAKGKTLDKKEEKCIKNWVEKLNKKTSVITIGILHRALEMLFDDPQELLQLEIGLLDRHLKLFKERDPDHIQWREGLKSGDILYCNGKEVQLGSQIGKKLYAEDNNVIYTIEGNCNEVVVIGINRAILRLKERIGKENGWGIRHANVLEIDREGKFALVERLQDPLVEQEWKGTKNFIHSEDRDTALPIAKAIKWMIEQDMTPKNFSAKHLMFNRDGVFKNAKICIPGEFDFIALEDVAIECARGNRTIYTYLMANSGLNTTRFYYFFESLAKRAVEGKKINVADIAAIKKISDPKIIDRGECFCGQVQRLKERCFQKIDEMGLSGDVEGIKSGVCERILNIYNSHCTASVLWPTLEEEVMSVLHKI